VEVRTIEVPVKVPQFGRTDAAVADGIRVAALCAAMRAAKAGLPGRTPVGRAAAAVGFGLATGWILLRDRSSPTEEQDSQ
jgi:hypothetical protein